jgi:hypothetical protein
MPEPAQNSPRRRDEQPLEAVLPPASEQTPALPPHPSDWMRSATYLDRLISAQENWQDALSALSGAIACHPETTQMLRRVTSTVETNAQNPIPGRSEWDKMRCEKQLYEARSHLHYYKKFFTEWLSGEEFFELFKKVWRPLPAELPTEETIRKQIDLLGGTEFYGKLLSTWEPHASQAPERAELLALVAKVIRFCGWQTHDPTAPTSNARQLPPLSDILEIRETLVTMLVLISNLIATEAPSNPIQLPELDSVPNDSGEVSNEDA